MKDFSTLDGKKKYHPGEILHVDPVKYRSWLQSGFIVEDKSLDGAREVK